MGFDPNNSIEYDQAMSLYIIDLGGLITANARKTYKYICQMHMSIDKAELDQCITDNKATAFLGFWNTYENLFIFPTYK